MSKPNPDQSVPPFLPISRRRFVRNSALLGAATWTATSMHGAARSEIPGAITPMPPKSEGRSAITLAPPNQQPDDLKIETPRKKLGWAIVGLGKLAVEEILPAFAKSEYSKPVALVSGHPDKAKKLAALYGIDAAGGLYNYENMDRLADNPAVDIVYIVLPNSMHEEYTIRALQAGKHVLCEKPMAATVTEAENMIAAAKIAGRQLMIAYRLHYEPFNQTVIDLCQRKAYGKIKTFSASNCQRVEAPNIRLSSKLAGGPLGDTGVYCINAARYCIGEEPVEVSAMHYFGDDPRFAEVPESIAFTMRFPSGAIACCDTSFNSPESRKYRVHCENGTIDLDPAFSYRGLELKVNDTDKTKKTRILLEAVDHFAKEMDHFSQCIQEGKTNQTPGEEGLADMKVMAAIVEAAQSGKTTKV